MKSGYVCHCWAAAQQCIGDTSRTALAHDVALSARAPTVAHETPFFGAVAQNSAVGLFRTPPRVAASLIRLAFLDGTAKLNGTVT